MHTPRTTNRDLSRKRFPFLSPQPLVSPVDTVDDDDDDIDYRA